MFQSINKIITLKELDKLKISFVDKKIVFTNGCFDIIHHAHIKSLKFAKSKGDILIVGINSDNSIKNIKGSTRPINNLYDRIELLNELDFIDYIIVFEEETPLNIIKNLKPNVLVKGGDYENKVIVGSEYVDEVCLFNYVPNTSTTNIIKKINNTFF